MPVQFGRNAYINTGAETTYGTAVTSSLTTMRLNSVSLQKTIERSKKTYLNHGEAGFVNSTFEAFNVTGGNITGPLHYAGNGDILLAALGSVTTTGSSAPRTHSFKPAADPVFLTVEVFRGARAGASNHPYKEVFKGCMVNTLTIACAAGEEMTFSAELICQDAAARTPDAAAPSFPTSAEAIFHHQLTAAGLNWNGSPNYEVRSFEIVIDNKLDRRNNLGSQLTAEPTISDVREVRMTVTMDLDSEQFYTDFITTPVFVDGDAILIFDGIGTHNQMTFTLHNAVVEEYSDPVATFGRIEATVTFLGTVSSGGAEGITIAMQNENASPI
jgi:hypothetical protein